MSQNGPSRVAIPVKAFGMAKGRLSPAMTADQRRTLARLMAEGVVRACENLPLSIVCDDNEVAEWAESLGADVEWTPGLGLNGAVQEAMRRASERGDTRLVVVHSDLPFVSGIEAFIDVLADEVKLVPDRWGNGTNVISVPSKSDFRFAFGPGSFDKHCREAERAGLSLTVLRSERLGWDIDEPQDISVPAELARHSSLVGEGLLTVATPPDGTDSGTGNPS